MSFKKLIGYLCLVLKIEQVHVLLFFCVLCTFIIQEPKFGLMFAKLRHLWPKILDHPSLKDWVEHIITKNFQSTSEVKSVSQPHDLPNPKNKQTCGHLYHLAYSITLIILDFIILAKNLIYLEQQSFLINSSLLKKKS